MPADKNGLTFDTVFDPVVGQPVEVAPGVVRIVAPNASPYTFTGTNTYLIGTDEVFVLDPGPDDSAHLAAILAAVGTRPVRAILLTHTHKDHCDLARRLAAATGAPLWFGGPHRLSRPRRLFEFNLLSKSCDWKLVPDRTLEDGETLEIPGLQLQVFATPGHCANHLAFGVIGSPTLFSGDHVMGWNSTLVATPDGSMAAYFLSLDKLIAAAWTYYLPGHGDVISEGRDFARALKMHRQMRNEQIVAAVADGATDVAAIVERLYPGVPSATRRAATMTVEAHVEYLAGQKRLKISRLFGMARISPPHA